MPKSAATRQRRNRSTTAATVEAGPAIKAPLPEHYHLNTLATWDVWWSSPLVEEWVDADIPGLLELARLVNAFWLADNTADSVKLRSEIRLSSREYGLSPLSRRQLQWEVKRLAKPAVAPAVTPRRSRDPRLSLVG